MIRRFVELLSRYKRHVATVALIAGFFVDLVTFRNLDLSVTQIILSAHLVVVAGSILLLYSSLFMRVGTWILVANQYSTGSLLSAFLVLYSASGSLVASWPFFVLVFVSAIGNEVARLEKYRLPLQTTLFFLTLTLFTALAVPVAIGSIGAVSFFIAMWAAVAAFVVFVWIGRVAARRAFHESAAHIRVGWIAVFVLMLVFYVTNLIPPIPLSLKAAGFYHSVTHTSNDFIAEDETRGFFERFFDVGGTTLRLAEGETVSVFTAIFAPARLDAAVVHRWEYHDPGTRLWRERNTVRFSISGGRHDGYRLYSLIDDPDPGRYRVSVETRQGQIVGRLYLTVVGVSTPVPTRLIMLE